MSIDRSFFEQWSSRNHKNLCVPRFSGRPKTVLRDELERAFGCDLMISMSTLHIVYRLVMGFLPRTDIWNVGERFFAIFAKSTMISYTYIYIYKIVKSYLELQHCYTFILMLKLSAKIRYQSCRSRNKYYINICMVDNLSLKIREIVIFAWP